MHSYSRAGRFSGVGFALRQYLFKDRNATFHTAEVVKSTGPLEKAVESDPWAVGVTGVSSARRRDVKMLTLEGRGPSYENIQSGDYLIYRPLYLVGPPTPSGNVTRFIEFARSNKGKEVLRRSGTVPYADALHLMTNRAIYGADRR